MPGFSRVRHAELSAETRLTWQVPQDVQKFYLTGELLFTYAILYEPARTFRKRPSLLSEPQTYAKLQ